jgi:hypothetical protein
VRSTSDIRTPVEACQQVRSGNPVAGGCIVVAETGDRGRAAPMTCQGWSVRCCRSCWWASSAWRASAAARPPSRCPARRSACSATSCRRPPATCPCRLGKGAGRAGDPGGRQPARPARGGDRDTHDRDRLPGDRGGDHRGGAARPRHHRQDPDLVHLGVRAADGGVHRAGAAPGAVGQARRPAERELAHRVPAGHLDRDGRTRYQLGQRRAGGPMDRTTGGGRRSIPRGWWPGCSGWSRASG